MQNNSLLPPISISEDHVINATSLTASKKLHSHSWKKEMQPSLLRFSLTGYNCPKQEYIALHFFIKLSFNNTSVTFIQYNLIIIEWHFSDLKNSFQW